MFSVLHLSATHVCYSVLPGELPWHKQCHNNMAGLTFTICPVEEIMTLMLPAKCMIIIPVTIYMYVHSWLFQGSCQEFLMPDELCIHLFAQICTFLLCPPNQSLLTTDSSAGKWDRQCGLGHLHRGGKKEF